MLIDGRPFMMMDSRMPIRMVMTVVVAIMLLACHMIALCFLFIALAFWFEPGVC